MKDIKMNEMHKNSINDNPNRAEKLPENQGEKADVNGMKTHPDVPEKFINPDTGEINLADFVQSYRELEKAFSMRSPAPDVPKSAEEYVIDCSHGMFESDPDMNLRLHEKGFTNDQAQEVYNLAADKMMPLIAQVAADFEADREVEKLVSHFGGLEQWKPLAGQLLKFGQKSLPPETLEQMSSSFDGVIALHKLMTSDEPTLDLSDEGMDDAGALDEASLQKLMRNPKYWRDRDPAFVRRVTEGFKSVYGE